LLEQVRNGHGADGGVPESIARRVSARELEVLLLLDQHLGTDQIARRLFISEHTMRSHVKSLLRKLDVSSRRGALEALAAAHHPNWVNPVRPRGATTGVGVASILRVTPLSSATR